MSELSKNVNKFFNEATKTEIDNLRKELSLTKHLDDVLIMKYIEKKDIDFIAYKTGYSRGKIEADLRLLRRKIAKLTSK